MFVAFLEPQTQLAIDQPLPTPAYQLKVLETDKSVRGLCYQEVLPTFWFLSCVDSLLIVEDKCCQKLAAVFE